MSAPGVREIRGIVGRNPLTDNPVAVTCYQGAEMVEIRIGGNEARLLPNEARSLARSIYRLARRVET